MPFVYYILSKFAKRKFSKIRNTDQLQDILKKEWDNQWGDRLEITGTDGIISIDYIDQSIDVYGKFAQDVQIQHDEPLMDEIRSFLSSVRNDEEPEITGEDGIYALRTVLAAMKSSREHRPIKLNGESE